MHNDEPAQTICSDYFWKWLLVANQKRGISIIYCTNGGANINGGGSLFFSATRLNAFQAKYKGERVGVALDPLPKGPFFRNVGPGGFAKDTSPAATLADRAK